MNPFMPTAMHTVYFDFSSIETPEGAPITCPEEALRQFLVEFADTAREGVIDVASESHGIYAYRFTDLRDFHAIAVLYFNPACTPGEAFGIIQGSLYDSGGLSGLFTIATDQTFQVTVRATGKVQADAIAAALRASNLAASAVHVTEVNPC